jgi:hypothetical protein
MKKLPSDILNSLNYIKQSKSNPDKKEWNNTCLNIFWIISVIGGIINIPIIVGVGLRLLEEKIFFLVSKRALINLCHMDFL